MTAKHNRSVKRRISFVGSLVRSLTVTSSLLILSDRLIGDDHSPYGAEENFSQFILLSRLGSCN